MNLQKKSEVGQALPDDGAHSTFNLNRVRRSRTYLAEQRNERYAQLDVEFHLEMARLSGNAVMTTMLGTLLEELKPHLHELRWSPKRHVRTDESHARLYSALVAGDVTAAQSEIQAHLQVAYNTLLDQIRRPPQLKR